MTAVRRSARARRENRQNSTGMGSPLYLLTGVMLGLIAGIILSVIVAPVRLRDSSPDLLTNTDKTIYRLLVAQAYDANPVPQRAIGRIKLLKEDDAAAALKKQAAAMDVTSANLMRQLTNLYVVIGGMNTPPATLPPGPPGNPTDSVQAKLSPTPTQPPPTHTPTITPVPTRTSPPQPTSTLVPPPTEVGAPNLNPFILLSSAPDCTVGKTSGSLRVTVRDANKLLQDNIPVYIAWPTGLDRMVTVNGSAQYKLESGVNYSVRVGEGGDTVNNLSVPGCSDPSAGGFLGDWVLEFGQ